MEFNWKKFLIFDCMEDGQMYQDAIDSIMREDGYIKSNEIYCEVKEVGWESGKTSGRSYVLSPPQQYRHVAVSLLQESIDTNPALMEEDCYKIYQFINQDKKKGCVNFVTEPYSLDYKKDVDKRFAKEMFFDQYGWLSKVVYYESSSVSINPVTLVKTITYTNEILTVDFTWNVGSDGYTSDRSVTRKWMKESGTYSPSVSKDKIYTTFEAQNEGYRRRKNVSNILKGEVVGNILETEWNGVDVVNVLDAQDLGMPALNEIKVNLSGFEENNTVSDLITAIDGLSSVTYPFLENLVPSKGNKSIRQLAKDRVVNSQII